MVKVLLHGAGGLFVATNAQFVPLRPRIRCYLTAVSANQGNGFSFDV